MSPFEIRRRLLTIALLGGVPVAGWAESVPGSSTGTFAQFDAVYVPALFLTGSAGKTPDGPAKALAATHRLSDQWPAMKLALMAAVPDKKSWPNALQAVQGRLREAQTLASKAQWAQAHEALEHVRELLFKARRSLGIDYALDEFTAYHVAMEKLANATGVRRPAVETDFATARALWRRIETLNFDAATYGLSPARAQQLAQARAAESDALSSLSLALRGGNDAEVLKAAAAIKPPFVRAYVAFGALP